MFKANTTQNKAAQAGLHSAPLIQYDLFLYHCDSLFFFFLLIPDCALHLHLSVKSLPNLPNFTVRLGKEKLHLALFLCCTSQTHTALFH